MARRAVKVLRNPSLLDRHSRVPLDGMRLCPRMMTVAIPDVTIQSRNVSCVQGVVDAVQTLGQLFRAVRTRRSHFHQYMILRSLVFPSAFGLPPFPKLVLLHFCVHVTPKPL
jgi:hypothetical protein